MQDVDRYDALGVLCDLYVQETGEKWVYHSETSNFSLHGSKHLLPEQVAKWAGLKRNCCLPIMLDGEKKMLIDMTMEDGHKFDEIADVIDKCF